MYGITVALTGAGNQQCGKQTRLNPRLVEGFVSQWSLLLVLKKFVHNRDICACDHIRTCGNLYFSFLAGYKANSGNLSHHE